MSGTGGWRVGVGAGDKIVSVFILGWPELEHPLFLHVARGARSGG